MELVAGVALKFLSTPSSQRATPPVRRADGTSRFLSTPSSQRATGTHQCSDRGYGYFYPRPLRRGRPDFDRVNLYRELFLSTPSSQRATPDRLCRIVHHRFLSTPSSQRATWSNTTEMISTGNFYPRPLRRGRRSSITCSFVTGLFLSTPSSQRATNAFTCTIASEIISIHALFAEGDTSRSYAINCRGISIHALFAEGDTQEMQLKEGQLYFYPRPLRRGRLGYSEMVLNMWKFLSTPSSQRATR